MDSWIYDRVRPLAPVELPVRLGRGGRIHQLHHQNARAHRLHRSAGACWLAPAAEVSIGINRRLGSAATAAGGGTAHYARLDLNHRDGGSWTEGTERRATQLAASLLSDLGGGWSHLLAYEYQNENVHRPYWGTPVLQPAVGSCALTQAPATRTTTAPTGCTHSACRWLRSVSQWRVSDALQLRNTLYAYR